MARDRRTVSLLREFVEETVALNELKKDTEFLAALSNALQTSVGGPSPRTFIKTWIVDAERIMGRPLTRFEKASVTRTVNTRYHGYVRRMGSVEAGAQELKRVLDDKLSAWLERDELESRFGSYAKIHRQSKTD